MVRLPLALLAITSADVFEVSLPIGGEAELRCSVDDASDAPLQACAASAVAGLVIASVFGFAEDVQPRRRALVFPGRERASLRF